MDFENVLIPSDVNGTGFWRMLQPVMTGWSHGPETHVRNSVLQKLTIDQNFYKGASMVMVQRLTDESGKLLLDKFLKPLGQIFGFWTIYNIDDAMHYRDIPLYNRGRAAFLGDDTQNRIGEMLRESDFILTTTNYIKNYYHRVYDVPLDHIIALPNLLPRWWASGLYDKDKKVQQFVNSKKGKNRPRVGFISSLSHFNLDNVHRMKDGSGGAYRTSLPNGGKVWRDDRGNLISDTSLIERAPDDLDLIEKTIRDTVDDVHWVIMGYTPPSLSDLLNSGKIEYAPSVDIINYPKRLAELNLQAVVAPLQDQEFNRCKSNIKYLECAALGIVLYASDIITYNRFLPESQLFSADPRDLTEKIKNLAYKMSTGVYSSIIERQWRWLNSPAEEGDFTLKNWWMEDNFGIWLSLFRMQHKSANVSFKLFREAYDKIIEKESQAKVDGDASSQPSIKKNVATPMDGAMLDMLKAALKKKIAENKKDTDTTAEQPAEQPAGAESMSDNAAVVEKAEWAPKTNDNAAQAGLENNKPMFEDKARGVKIVM